MANFLIILFIMSLIYVAKVEMVKSYFSLMAVQGIILFGLAYVELKENEIIQLLFILVETLIFKAIFVPIFLSRITKDKIHRHHSGPIKGYYWVLFSTAIIVISFLCGYMLHDEFGNGRRSAGEVFYGWPFPPSSWDSLLQLITGTSSLT